MKKSLFLGLMLTTLLVSGCSTTVGTSPKTVISSFDGSKTIGIIPHGGACKTIICPALGATWIDTDSYNTVGLHVQLVNEYASILAVAFNIDGRIVELKPQGVTKFENIAGKTSQQTVVTDYKIIDDILNSKRTWMRLSTDKGSYEVAIIDGATDSKAYHALQRFDQQVKNAR